MSHFLDRTLFMQKGPVLTRNASKNWPKLVFLSDMKTQLNYLWGSSGGTSLGLLVWEAARPATALSLLPANSLQTTFSDIENSGSDERCDAALAELSGCNIYKMMSARAWRNVDCSLAMPKLENAIGATVNKSSLCLINICDIVCLKCFFFPVAISICKAPFNVSQLVLRSCDTMTFTVIVMAVMVWMQRLFIVSSRRVII